MMIYHQILLGMSNASHGSPMTYEIKKHQEKPAIFAGDQLVGKNLGGSIISHSSWHHCPSRPPPTRHRCVRGFRSRGLRGKQRRQLREQLPQHAAAVLRRSRRCQKQQVKKMTYYMTSDFYYK